MDVGYVEKTFETYINAELLSINKYGWAPGQNEEGFVGFDFYYNMTDILQIKYLKRIYSGVGINDILRHVETKYSIILRKIPSIKVNMLLQYKCPEYLTKKSSKERSYWKKNYYRYKVDANQQKLIQDIYDNFSDVIILYVAPAIDSANKLFECAQKNKIIDNSNFTEGYRLTGHKVNTYVQAGDISKAFSEPEIIESFNLQQMNKMFESKKDVDNIQFWINFSNQIKETINKSSELVEGYKALFDIYTDNNEIDIAEYPLIDSLVTARVFRDLTGITSFLYV